MRRKQSAERNRVRTLDEMRRRRKAVDFCYLCGGSLSGPLQEEHVIPRALLRMVKVDVEPWPVILDVHEDCEKDKSAIDNWLVPFHRLPAQPFAESGARVSDCVPTKTIAVTESKVGEGVIRHLHGSGVQDYREGVWTWVRGLHCAIYGIFLPKEGRHFVVPPALAWSENGGPSQSKVEEISSVIRGAMVSSIKKDTWDGIVLWGDKVRYRCVWSCDAGAVYCFWVLEGLPALLFDMRPWHGYYRCSACPLGAARFQSGVCHFPPRFFVGPIPNAS